MFDNNMEIGSVNQERIAELEEKRNSALENGDYESATRYLEQIFTMYDIDMFYDNFMGLGDTAVGSTSVEELENFNPSEASDQYNALEAMELWEYQGNTNRCAQFSQMFVIEEFTGMDLNPDEFCAYAEQHGWFSEEGGTTLDNMNKMLNEFGIPNEMSQGKSFDDLLNCLNNDGRVIVAVDADEYWYDEGFWGDLFDPNGANHAIEVIGFDPETNCVIVNDSGNPDGCGSEIPLDTFLDAWEDSGNMMIECYDPYTLNSIPA